MANEKSSQESGPESGPSYLQQIDAQAQVKAEERALKDEAERLEREAEEEIANADQPSPARRLLAPLIPLYRMALLLHELQFVIGLKPVRRLRYPVISIGNLSTGGSGKTPLTIALAQALKRRGLRVDVLSRGYGRQSTQAARVSLDGNAEQFGDEPLLIADEAKVPVFVAPQRYDAGLLAEAEIEAELAVAVEAAQSKSKPKAARWVAPGKVAPDGQPVDGQAVPVWKEDQPASPPEASPADPSAEAASPSTENPTPSPVSVPSAGASVGAASAPPAVATAAIPPEQVPNPTASPEEKSLSEAEEAEAAEPAPLPLAVHLLDDGFQHRQLARSVDILLLNQRDWREWLLPGGNLREPVEAIRRASVIAIPASEPELESELCVWGWDGPIWRLRRKMDIPLVASPVAAFCGIARPEQFFAGIRTTGLEIAFQLAFPDHFTYTRGVLEEMLVEAREKEVTCVITTGKDLARLGKLTRLFTKSMPLVATRLRTEIEDPAAAIDWLVERLRKEF
jgi:tetraacyldisaccharide 4'-kinase